MTDLQCSPTSPSTSRHFSLRLSEKSKQKFNLPSRKEALDKVADDETPFKNYRKYTPRKLVNNFVKERNYYNNPDGIDLFDEFSDDNFIDDGSSSSSDESTQEGSIQSNSSSDSTSEGDEQSKTPEKPISRRGRNQRRITGSAGSRSDSEEELARPLKTHKQRLPASLSSGSETSSEEDVPLPSQRKKRHVRVSIQSDGSSDDEEEDQPRASTQDPSGSELVEAPPIQVKLEVKEETSNEAEDSRSTGMGSFSAIKSSPSDDEPNQPWVIPPGPSGSEPVKAPVPEIKIEVKTEKRIQSEDIDKSNGMNKVRLYYKAKYRYQAEGEESLEDTSSSSDGMPDFENDSTDSDTDNDPNGVDQGQYGTDSEDSFIATSSSSDGTPGHSDTSGINKPSHEELICNYRQRKQQRKHPVIRKKRRICLPSSESDRSCSLDGSASGEEKSDEHLDDSAIRRLPSKRAKRLRKKKRAWETEVLGSYRDERERKLSKK
ncbi:suppressor protein SRP40-like [Patiria miniata]|uniref:Uncharacterized protein n=1 Tax=Patiria miniata TaxID=46514 RepID=A0A914BA61_PATMI|nr:suppressor protein SRP40-like [Patiria miniata]